MEIEDSPVDEGEIESAEDQLAGETDLEASSLYSFPAALHFLHQEWRRFESERNIWELERSELKTRLAVLEGEKKGFEVLKVDLLKRIKMLEYALREERRNSKQKTSADNKPDSFVAIQPPETTTTIVTTEAVPNATSSEQKTPNTANMLTVNRSFTLGRQTSKSRDILKQYLQEVGYMDNQSQPVSSSAQNKRASRNFGTTSAAFINSTSGRPSSSSRPRSTINEMFYQTPTTTAVEQPVVSRRPKEFAAKQKRQQVTNSVIYAPEDIEKLSDPQNWKPAQMAVDSKAPSNLMDLNDTADGKIGLDSELADMKLSDDASGGSKSSSKKATDGKQCWTTKFTLRSHLDSVTSAAFHSNNLSLVTAGEDACIKYWNLEQASSSSSTKKNAHVDLEPVRVYRGHEGRVNTVLLANLIPPSIDSKYQQYLEYGMVLSGGSDCDLHLWSVPGPEDQLYGKCKYKTVALARFSAHQDAIWSMKLHDIRPLLATASADGYVKLWNLNNLTDDHFSKGKIAAGDVVCRSLSFNGEMAYKDGDPIPTSIDFVHSESNLLVAAFNNSQAKVFDVETGKCVRKLEGADQTYNMTPATQINQVIVHKTANTIVTAHEDRFIRFFDCRTGGHVHGMVAHLDSVSCIDISPNGMVLASGGHDGSVRFWDIASKTCLQEFTFHRKKFEESVNSVLFHPRLSPASSSPADSTGTQVCGGSSWFVSCGADSTARVYNCL